MFFVPPQFGTVEFCSALCRIGRDARRPYYSKARRWKYQAGDKVDPLVIFEHYDWVCHLCTGGIDRALRCPSPFAATLDHVQPLSLGGTHCWDNLRPAHNWCNSDKSDRLDVSLPRVL